MCNTYCFYPIKRLLESASVLHISCIVLCSCFQSVPKTYCAYNSTQHGLHFSFAYLRFSFDFPPSHDSQTVTIFPVRRLCTSLPCMALHHYQPFPSSPILFWWTNSKAQSCFSIMNWNKPSFTFVVSLSTAAVMGYVGQCRLSVR